MGKYIKINTVNITMYRKIYKKKLAFCKYNSKLKANTKPTYNFFGTFIVIFILFF